MLLLRSSCVGVVARLLRKRLPHSSKLYPDLKAAAFLRLKAI